MIAQTSRKGPACLNFILAFFILQDTQNSPIDIECTKGHQACKEYLPGGSTELPVLFHSHSQCIEDKQKKENTMNGSHGLHPCRIMIDILSRHRNKQQDQQGNAFEKTDQ